LDEWERLTLEEARKLSAQAMEENIRILQALADHDRSDPNSPWRQGKFVLDPRRELKAAIGSVDGWLLLPVEDVNEPTGFQELAPVGKPQSAST
jgi:hypothetical protein